MDTPLLMNKGVIREHNTLQISTKEFSTAPKHKADFFDIDIPEHLVTYVIKDGKIVETIAPKLPPVTGTPYRLWIAGITLAAVAILLLLLLQRQRRMA